MQNNNGIVLLLKIGRLEYLKIYVLSWGLGCGNWHKKCQKIGFYGALGGKMVIQKDQ
jgi:hypothetical protein